MINSESFFCHLPFVSVLTDGHSARPCCKYEGPQMNLTGYISNPTLVTMKKQLWQGKAPAQCQQCVTDESNSGKSNRTLANNFHSHLSEEVLAQDETYTSIRFVDVVGSNVCNLQCLPCEFGSYKRSKELYNLGLTQNIPIYREIRSVAKIVDLDMEGLTLCSGEPFYDKQCWTLLNLLVETHKSKKIKLDINTNLTAVTEGKLDWLSENFQQVLIKGSIDGVDNANHYLRYPSDWHQITTAVEYILCRPNIKFVITTALSNLGLLKYHQLVKYFSSLGVKDFFISQVSSPGCLHAGNLPRTIKDILLCDFQDLLLCPNLSDRAQNAIETCVNLCRNDHPWQADPLVEFLIKHDQHRGTNWRSVWPNLAEHC